MAPIELDAGPGWTETAPRPDGPELLVECAGRLEHLRSDGQVLHDFGPVGPVPCPLTYDPHSRVAYRYVSSARLASATDYSQLRAFCLKQGTSHPVCEIPLNQRVLWLLEWVGGDAGQLFGLLASDLPVGRQICIQHRLFTCSTAGTSASALRTRSLCRDAYEPLVFSARRKQLIFSGAEGTHLVGLKGERLATLPPETTAPAASASFDPSGRPRAILGGEGLHLWDFQAGSCTRLIRPGRHPLWSPQGDHLWYAGSSASFRSFDLNTEQSEPLLAIRHDRVPDFWKSRPARLSHCGDYLAVMLSAKRLKGITRKTSGIEKAEKVYQDQNCFAILHPPTHQFWRIEGRFFHAFRWV